MCSNPNPIYFNALSSIGLSVSRIKVKDFDEKRLNQFGIDLEEELNVRLVETVEVLQFADQVEVDAARVATVADRLQVAPQQVVVRVLRDKSEVHISLLNHEKFLIHFEPHVCGCL